MKRDPASAVEAEETIQVPAALHFNMIDRLLDLSGGRIEFRVDGPAPVPASLSTRLDRPLPAIGEAFEDGVFAGITLHDGQRMALVLLAGEREEIAWEDAKKWAAEQGGELPSRIDGLVLFESGAKLGFAREWYWISAPYASVASCAWLQDFINGFQGCYHTSSKGRCRAVRRVPI